MKDRAMPDLFPPSHRSVDGGSPEADPTQREAEVFDRALPQRMAEFEAATRVADLSEADAKLLADLHRDGFGPIHEADALRLQLDAANARIAALENEVHYFKVQYQDEEGIHGLQTQLEFAQEKIAALGADKERIGAGWQAVEQARHNLNGMVADRDSQIAALTSERDAALAALQAVMRYYPSSQDAFPAHAVLAGLRKEHKP